MKSVADDKPKILLGYLSSDLEDFFTRVVAPAGYEVRCISFKEPGAILDTARWAHAIFIQWDGRGQMGHDLIQRMNQSSGSLKPGGTIYGVTTSSIKIEILPPKQSRQANISGWYNVPDDKDLLLTELSLLMPDSFDDFSADVTKANMAMLGTIPLESLAGKHLIGVIKKAWDERAHRAATVTRIKDEILRSHVTFFHEDDARTNDLHSFLTEVSFKYHDEFSDLSACMRWIRGHGTDCIVVWYDTKSEQSATLLRMLTENRSFRRIPIVVLYAAEADIAHFKSQCGDLFVDKFIQFDRHREKFRTALIEAFELAANDRSDRRLLDELRSQAQDFPADGVKSLSMAEIDAACDKIATESSKKYWADTERLLGISRLRDVTRFSTEASDYGHKYHSFDATLSLMLAHCVTAKENIDSKTCVFVESIMAMGDLNMDRLARAAMTLARLGATKALTELMNSWWQSKDKLNVGHEFYFVLSRMANQSGLTALERALLALAIKGDPLRHEYVEAYAQHLLATGHPRQALRLAEILQKSEYFPAKRAAIIVFNAHVMRDDKSAANKTLQEMTTRWPQDKQVAALKSKLPH